jgi:hypothetical protein
MFTGMTKSEAYHILIGLLAAAVWTLGKKFDLPNDVIVFAGTTTVAVVSHAIGVSGASPSAPTTVINTTDITAAAPGEAKAP